MTVAEFASQFGFTVQGTGGGCDALWKDLPDGGYLMITEELNVPENLDAEVDDIIVGRYDSQGECIAWATAPTARAAIMLVAFA